MRGLFGFLAGMLLYATSLFGSTCTPGTLQDYINLGSTGCDIDVVHFADFLIAPGAGFATPIDPSLVQVTPSGSLGDVAFLFTLNSSAGAGDVFESFFHFDVTAANLVLATIALNSAAATGDGAVTGVLDVCPDSSFLPGLPAGCGGSPQTAIAAAIEGLDIPADPLLFSPAGFFDVFVDLTVDGGLDGTASLESARVGFTAVPEPSTSLLLVAGLITIGALRTRRS